MMTRFSFPYRIFRAVVLSVVDDNVNAPWASFCGVRGQYTEERLYTWWILDGRRISCVLKAFPVLMLMHE